MNTNAIMLSETDWDNVVRGIPDLEKLSGVRDQFKVVEFFEGGQVDTDGMYVVLHGTVSLRLRGQEIGKARLHDFFFEEHLVIDGIDPEMQAYALVGSRLLKLDRVNWESLPTDSREYLTSYLFGDLVNVHMHDFQQPINCCNITAAAFSLTSLGFPTHVDDIFQDCRLPTSYVVNTGLTLSEMYDVACTYVSRRGLKDQLDVECYFFDESLVSEEDLMNCLAESDLKGGESDILVANFGVGLAHDIPNNDGGHFALIAKCNQSTGIIHMVDVHPEKYGKLWVTNVSRLYQAMAQRDRSSCRARGLLRFSAHTAQDTYLTALTRKVESVDLTDHLLVDRQNIRTLFQRATTNLNSLTTVAASLRLAGVPHLDADQMMQAAQLSPTKSLSYSPSTMALAEVIKQYQANTGTSSVRCVAEEFSKSSEIRQTAMEWLRGHLDSLTGNFQRQIILNLDLNKVVGCEAIKLPNNTYQETAVLEEFWCICLNYDRSSDLVTLTDNSASTSLVWRTTAANLFSGLRDVDNPSLLLIDKNRAAAEQRVSDIVQDHPLVLFYTDDDPWSYMLQSILSNIGVTEVHKVNLSGRDEQVLRQRQQLIALSGKDELPYLFFKGECLGEVEGIVQFVQDGSLQHRFKAEGLHVLMKTQTPSLDKNIYGYPKGGLSDAADEKKNILVCCCGSSAADKIPELVERLVAAGHDVKLVPSLPAEHFFRDFGMQRIQKALKPSDIYRDDDEWNFRYTEFGMPVRACHLALCDWADCVVVAPITCNTMGKIASGVADSLLTSVFVAWQYQRKPVILCPACNTNMWNNLTTQHNVGKLQRLGARFSGPKSGILSNGTIGTGMMATIDEICDTVLTSLAELEDQEARVMRWGKQAAAADDAQEWLKIFRCIDEDVVGVDVCAEDTGDTLLHYAAGGEGEMLEHGIEKGNPDFEAARDLISRGINVNIANDFEFTPLHVAIMNDSPEMVQLLLDAGADATSSVSFIQSRDTHPAVAQLIQDWAATQGLKIPKAFTPTVEPTPKADTALYFTYGSLKRGFPNHKDHAETLSDFVGTAITRQAMPLIVPKEPDCTNPNCPWLHRMPALVNVKGKGVPVTGEVYRLPASKLAELDKLEGYVGPGHPDNIYERKTITVRMGDDLTRVQTYVIANGTKQLNALKNSEAESVAEYTMAMAAVTPKPERD